MATVEIDANVPTTVVDVRDFLTDKQLAAFETLIVPAKDDYLQIQGATYRVLRRTWDLDPELDAPFVLLGVESVQDDEEPQ